MSEGSTRPSPAVGSPQERRSVREFSVAALGGARRDPVVGILLIAGFFDWISGNPIDSILLVATGLALAGRRPEPSPATRGAAAGVGSRKTSPRSPALVAGVLLSSLAYATVTGNLARFSWPASFAVVLPAGAVLILVWRTPGPAQGSTSLRPADAPAWAAVFVGVGLWELTNLLLQPSLTTDSYAHPTLSVLSDGFLGSYPGRSVGLFLWLMLGWYLVDR